MKYLCDECDYGTNNKSNFNRHLKTIHEPAKELLSCEKCNQVFSHQSSLSRHENYRCHTIRSELDIIKAQFTEYQIAIKAKEMELENKYLKEKNNDLSNEVTELKSIIETKKDKVYNISVKNYVQQNYPDAPPLIALKEYEPLLYEYNEDSEESEDNEEIDVNKNNVDDLASNLIYNFNNSCLDKYLGEFIVKYYKKDDPSKQSLWSSDTSRLTYIIKELLSNNKTIWSHDHKGIKVKEYIINPLLKYIKNYIDEYWVTHIDNFKKFDNKIIIKHQMNYLVLYQIKKEIENNVLSSDIVRYISPHFCLSDTINNKLIN